MVRISSCVSTGLDEVATKIKHGLGYPTVAGVLTKDALSGLPQRRTLATYKELATDPAARYEPAKIFTQSNGMLNLTSYSVVHEYRSWMCFPMMCPIRSRRYFLYCLRETECAWKSVVAATQRSGRCAICKLSERLLWNCTSRGSNSPTRLLLSCFGIHDAGTKPASLVRLWVVCWHGDFDGAGGNDSLGF